jgi:hypothetical protein
MAPIWREDIWGVQRCLGAASGDGTLGTNNSTTNLTAGEKQKAALTNDL